MANTLKNTLINSLDPTRFRVMLRKLWLRVMDKRGSISREDNLRWVRTHCSDFAAMAEQKSPALWREALEWSESMRERAARTLAALPESLGGGGIYPYLYFLTRWLEPRCIVETGVAAGYSSCAFLTALEKNGAGTLFSSDFPYFRLADPEQYIGVLVDESLRERWELYTAGDEVNLPKIASTVQEIDLFHYDSDKRLSSRQRAMSIVSPKLSSSAVIIMDDIEDNPFFYDYLQATGTSEWNIFEFEGKYVGIIWGAGSLPHE